LDEADAQTRFKSFLEDHQGVIAKVARAYTSTTDDFQDLVQEILLQLWRSLPSFEQRSSASTWMYRVALNTALLWRRNARNRSGCRQPVFDIGEIPAGGADSAGQAEDRELIERMYAAIQQLTPSDTALVLLYLDGLSYRQMAEVLGLTESNVGVKLNRAKKELSQLMKDAGHEP
jgi:RNA polymerase sigma-70 factor, ECF subfamily